MVVADWTGGYVGVNLGGGFGNSGSDLAGGNPLNAILVNTGAIPNHLNTQGGGVVGGGQIGYNRQFGDRWVLGIESDLQGSGIKGNDSKGLSLVPLGLPLSLTTTGEKKLNWYGNFVGRVGYIPFDSRLMLYAKGGLAFGDVSHSVTSTLSGIVNASVESSVRTGYVVGGGMDLKMMPGWTVGADYSYIDLGNNGSRYGATVLGAPVAFVSNHRDTFHVGKLKLNYELGNWGL